MMGIRDEKLFRFWRYSIPEVEVSIRLLWW